MIKISGIETQFLYAILRYINVLKYFYATRLSKKTAYERA